MGQTPRTVAVGLLGALFLVSQVLILRGFLLIFQGNEGSIGIVLGNWFLLEALGSWLGGKWAAGRHRDPLAGFVAIQALLSLLLPATLLSILASRHLPGVSPWEAMSLARLALLSFFLLAPLAVGNGLAFVLACRLLGRGKDRDARAAGKVYALEALGALVGGLACTFFLVERFSPMGVAFLMGALNMAGALVLVLRTGGGETPLRQEEGAPKQSLRVARAAVLLLLPFFLFGLLTPFAERVQRWGTETRWRPLTVLRSLESVHGNITVLEMGGERVFYLSGVPSIFLPFPDLTAVEDLVHLPLLAHPLPREVLFVGGGVGGALAEAQKHPLRRISYTEIDPLLIRTVREASPGEAARELDEPRTRVLTRDGRAFLKGTHDRFDVIINHLPDASTLQLNRFYTREFFSLVRDRLQPQGLFAVGMPGSSSYLSENLLRLNRCVWDTLREVFAHVRLVPGERNLFLASADADLSSLDPGTLEARLEERELRAAVVGPAYFRYRLEQGREAWALRELASVVPGRINRDLSPVLLYDFLAWKSAEVQPVLRRPISVFERVTPAGFLAGGVVLSLLLLFRTWAGKGGADFAVQVAVLGSGFAGMAVELSVLLAFQSVCGYLYQWLGLLIAAFMAGLALGSWCFAGLLDRLRHGYRAFFLLDAALAGLLLFFTWALPASHLLFVERTDLGHVPQVLFLILNLLAGLLVGSEFPLAVREALVRGGKGGAEAAGKLYALDLAGAWLGTFLASLVLIPLLGMGGTLAFAAALKGGCLVLLLLGCLAHVRKARRSGRCLS